MNTQYENALVIDLSVTRTVVKGGGNVVEVQDADGKPLVCFVVPARADGSPFPHGTTAAEAFNGVGLARAEKLARQQAKAEARKAEKAGGKTTTVVRIENPVLQ